MHTVTRHILLAAANRCLLQNTSGNLAHQVRQVLDSTRIQELPDAQSRVVEHELKVLGLLGSGNGGYLT